MVWTGTDTRKWAAETKERLMATVRTAAQMLDQEMGRTIPEGGNLPIKTGNLRRSRLAQIGSMPKMGEAGALYTVGQDIGPVLLAWKPGEKLFLGFQSNYAHRQNYGFFGEDSLGRTYAQSGFAFVEKAAAKWPFILEAAAAKVRTQSLSSTSLSS